MTAMRFAFLRKLTRIGFGLLAQMLTAAAGLGVIGRMFSNGPHRNAMLDNPFAAALIYAVAFGTFYARYLLLPMIAFVMVCESRSYRDWRPYAIAGAASTILVVAQVPFVSAYAMFVLLAALVGLISGLCYWLIAGRFAGSVTPAKAAVP